MKTGCWNCFLTLALGFVLTGCAPTQPKSYQVTHRSVLEREGGVLLLVDACVLRDDIGKSGDYFIIEETKAGAEAALASMRKMVQDSGLRVSDAVVLICGAPHGVGGAPIRVAPKVGGKVTLAKQPIGASPGVENDPEYLQALTVVSTYAIERAGVSPNGKTLLSPTNGAASIPATISPTAFRDAAGVVQKRTGAATLCYLGILGHSDTGGKVFGQTFLSVAIGMGTGMATAGLGAGFYVAFGPVFAGDGMVMEGALVELESGDLNWSRAIVAGGDPAKPKVIADAERLNLLFHDIMFQSVSDANAAPAISIPKP